MIYNLRIFKELHLVECHCRFPKGQWTILKGIFLSKSITSKRNAMQFNYGFSPIKREKCSYAYGISIIFSDEYILNQMYFSRQCTSWIMHTARLILHFFGFRFAFYKPVPIWNVMCDTCSAVKKVNDQGFTISAKNRLISSNFITTQGLELTLCFAFWW